MKKRGLKVIVIALFLTLFAGTTVYAAVKGVVKTTEPYLTLEEDVFYPMEMVKDHKYPVVFMAHNGGQDRTAWGDFPQQIANEGFITVNITWQAWDAAQVETAINYTLSRYADVIDTEKVFFIGGCHGGKDFFDILNKDDVPYTVKASVFLSVSEIDDSVTAAIQKKDHAPMLVFYSENDEIGEYYTGITKKLADQVTKPCMILPQKDPAHGDNMVTNSSNKDEVRKEIINWVKTFANK